MRPDPRPGRQRGHERRFWLLTAVTAAVVVVAALFPLIWDRRFYFMDDTQLGAYGIWYELGDLVLEGRLPVINPHTWMAGNYWVEGQWGLLNPLILVIGLGSHLVADAAVYSTMVKIAALAVSSVGTSLLLRSYRVRPALVVAGALAVPLSGFTLYMDAASWVTGLFCSALVPWFWFALRRQVARRGLPWWPFVTGYLVITVGYVHGTLALIAVLGAVLLDCLVARNRDGFLRVLVVGVALGAVALLVYLPQILSSDVTVRSSDAILNDGFLNTNLSSFAASWIPTATPPVYGWWGAVPAAPLVFIAWFIPLLAFVDVRAITRRVGDLWGVAMFGLVWIAFVTGPSILGPLRFPTRMMPYVALAVVVVCCVVLSRGWSTDRLPRRFAVSALITLVGAWATYSIAPGYGMVHRHGMLIVLAGTAVVAVLLTRRFGGRGRVPVRRQALLACAAFAVVTLVVSFHQHLTFPTSPLPDYGAPSAVAAHTGQVGDAEGDVFVIGVPPDSAGPSVWQEATLANLWYLNDRHVANTYTPVGFAAFGAEICIDNRGSTCEGSLDALLAPVGGTGTPLVDVMGIDTLLLYQHEVPDRWESPPPGWRLGTVGAWTAAWVREDPLGSVGGVGWATPGTEVGDVVIRDDRTTFTVDSVPDGGADVVLGRLAWPGYRTSVGELGEPADGFLLRVHLEPEDAGSQVVVSYVPPGVRVGAAATALSLLVLGAWTVVERRRRAAGTSRARGTDRAGA